MIKMKLLAPAVFLFLAFSMSSCTQEYICQCVAKYSGVGPGLPDSAVHEFAIKNTKKVASTECEANSISITENGITLDEKCKLY
jgi:hypothetical protein